MKPDPKFQMFAWQMIMSHRLSILFKWVRVITIFCLIGVLIYDGVEKGYWSVKADHRTILTAGAIFFLSLPLPRWIREALL